MAHSSTIFSLAVIHFSAGFSLGACPAIQATIIDFNLRFLTMATSGRIIPLSMTARAQPAQHSKEAAYQMIDWDIAGSFVSTTKRPTGQASADIRKRVCLMSFCFAEALGAELVEEKLRIAYEVDFLAWQLAGLACCQVEFQQAAHQDEASQLAVQAFDDLSRLFIEPPLMFVEIVQHCSGIADESIQACLALRAEKRVGWG